MKIQASWSVKYLRSRRKFWKLHIFTRKFWKFKIFWKKFEKLHFFNFLVHCGPDVEGQKILVNLPLHTPTIPPMWAPTPPHWFYDKNGWSAPPCIFHIWLEVWDFEKFSSLTSVVWGPDSSPPLKAFESEERVRRTFSKVNTRLFFILI